MITPQAKVSPQNIQRMIPHSLDTVFMSSMFSRKTVQCSMVHADGLDFLQHLEHRRTHIYTVTGQSRSIKYVHVQVFLFVLVIKDRECLPFYPTSF